MALYHSARGSVNYTIVGSPTIVDGVVSGFSNSNYLTLTTIPQGSSIEFNFRFTPTETPAGAFFRFGASAYRGILEWLGNGTNTMRFSYREIGSTTTKYKSFNVPLNVPINYNMVFNSSTNTLVSTITSNNTTQVIKTANVDGAEFTSTAMLGYVGSNRLSLNGSIDLNNTYIKVNGQPWFGICPIEVKKHQLMGPVGYTVTGSPTIVDGVASNFSLNSYCLVNTPFAPGNSSWEIDISFNLAYPGSRKNVALINSTLADYVFPKITVQTESSTTLGVQALLSSNGTSGNINASAVIVPYDYSKNSHINLKYVPTTSTTGNYILSFKQEGQEFTTLATYSNKSYIFQNPNDTGFSIGADIGAPANWRSFFIGSIDLNETYIKVNGKLWFWQPRETEKIVVNGVQVWQKSS